jgi:hypothetical protein
MKVSHTHTQEFSHPFESVYEELPSVDNAAARAFETMNDQELLV